MVYVVLHEDEICFIADNEYDILKYLDLTDGTGYTHAGFTEELGIDPHVWLDNGHIIDDISEFEALSDEIKVEAMGRYAGFLALSAGVGGAADAILIPEIPYNIEKVAESLKKSVENGKNYAIVVVAEGAKPKDGEVYVSKVIENSPDPIRLGGIANVVAEQLEALVGLEARATILGHVQRTESYPHVTAHTLLNF